MAEGPCLPFCHPTTTSYPKKTNSRRKKNGRKYNKVQYKPILISAKVDLKYEKSYFDLPNFHAC